MTIDQIAVVILVLLFAVGAILAVAYIWFRVWKTVSERSGNIVTWPNEHAGKQDPVNGDEPGKNRW